MRSVPFWTCCFLSGTAHNLSLHLMHPGDSSALCFLDLGLALSYFISMFRWSISSRRQICQHLDLELLSLQNLTLGGLWEPTPFLLQLFGRSFRGSPISPTGALRPRPGSCKGAAVAPLTSGAKVGAPQCFQTGSRRSEPTRASGRGPPL